MSLDQKTIDQITEWINVRWKNKHCALCGHNSWTINGYIVLPVGNVPVVLSIGGPALPCASVVCGNCGNTLFLNLAIVGIVKP